MSASQTVRVVTALGGLGVLLLIVDDIWRFALASPYVGASAAIIGTVACALLLVAAVVVWRRERPTAWVCAVLLLTMLGRVAVPLEPAVPYWVVTVAHLSAPVAAVFVGEHIFRRSRAVVRGLAIAVVLGALCWLLATWTPSPWQLVPFSRAATVIALVGMLLVPVGRQVRRGLRRLWESAKVR